MKRFIGTLLVIPLLISLLTVFIAIIINSWPFGIIFAAIIAMFWLGVILLI